MISSWVKRNAGEVVELVVVEGALIVSTTHPAILRCPYFLSQLFCCSVGCGLKVDAMGMRFFVLGELMKKLKRRVEIDFRILHLSHLLPRTLPISRTILV